MSEQPMLEIRTDTAGTGKCVVNLLPCRVQHTGPTGPSSAYWNPSVDDNGIRTAYLRGRRLQGKTASLPADYRGVVLQRKDDETEPAEQPDVVMVGDDGDEESAPKLGTMHVVTEFDKVVVWSHDAVADASSDPYLRSVEEWFKVADSVSCALKQLQRNDGLM
ncbi:ribonuclease H2 non-catalytic subunit domain-containing protein, partial [Trichoderma longibrachiatum]